MITQINPHILENVEYVITDQVILLYFAAAPPTSAYMISEMELNFPISLKLQKIELVKCF